MYRPFRPKYLYLFFLHMMYYNQRDCMAHYSFVSDLMLAYLCLTLQAVFLDVLIQKDIFVDNKCFASHSPQKSKYRGI